MAGRDKRTSLERCTVYGYQKRFWSLGSYQFWKISKPYFQVEMRSLNLI
jgi:hypothetical protein